MQRFLWMIILFSITACSTAGEVLEPGDFKAQSETEQGVLLDVRTPQEYQEGHIKNATNVNFFDEGFEARIKEMDRDKTYYVYCKSGGRSGKTAKIMAEAGFQHVFDLKGGMTGWAAAGLPVEK